MTNPSRLQLSRHKGFNLQKWSMELNGLPAVNCARPSKYGNPFYIINEEGCPWITDRRDKLYPVCNGEAAQLLGEREIVGFAMARRGVVALFKAQCLDGLKLAPLRGHNLACWCGLDEPCHVDVFLEVLLRCKAA